LALADAASVMKTSPIRLFFRGGFNHENPPGFQYGIAFTDRMITGLSDLVCDVEVEDPW